ncbi:MAG: hypothetical protein AAF583_06615 [Pseudomonadota bacterium]
MKPPGKNKVTETFKDAVAPDTSIGPARRKQNSAPFSIRFSDEERLELDRRRGVLSLGAYIRFELFTKKIDKAAVRKRLSRKHFSPSAEMTMVATMLGELGKSRLSSNMNQIAKAANLGALPVTPELEDELSAACADIKAMRHALIIALGLKDQDAL